MVPRKYLILLALAGFIVSLDQLTKSLVMARFRLGDTRQVIAHFLSISRVHNVGAAFGLLSTVVPEVREPIFYAVPTLTLLAILFIFYKLRQGQTMSIYALALIVGGALGNLADRLRLGFVIDFVDFHWRDVWHFPAFNFADMAISFGVAMLMLGLLSEREVEEPRASS